MKHSKVLAGLLALLFAGKLAAHIHARPLKNSDRFRLESVMGTRLQFKILKEVRIQPLDHICLHGRYAHAKIDHQIRQFVAVDQPDFDLCLL